MFKYCFLSFIASFLFWASLCIHCESISAFCCIEAYFSGVFGYPRRTAVLFFWVMLLATPGSTVLCTPSYFKHNIYTLSALLCHTIWAMCYRLKTMLTYFSTCFVFKDLFLIP